MIWTNGKMMVTIWKSLQTSSFSFLLLSVNSQIFAHLRSGAIESSAGSMHTWLLHINWHGLHFIRSGSFFSTLSARCHIRYHFVHIFSMGILSVYVYLLAAAAVAAIAIDLINTTNRMCIVESNTCDEYMHENKNVSSICVSPTLRSNGELGYYLLCDYICCRYHHPHHMIDILYARETGSKSRNVLSKSRATK